MLQKSRYLFGEIAQIFFKNATNGRNLPICGVEKSQKITICSVISYYRTPYILLSKEIGRLSKHSNLMG